MNYNLKKIKTTTSVQIVDLKKNSLFRFSCWFERALPSVGFLSTSHPRVLVTRRQHYRAVCE